MEVFYMKFIVISLHRHHLRNSVLSLLLILVICCTLAFSVWTKLTRDELFAHVNGEYNEAKIVVVDAGHGGEDSGAIGQDGILEKTLNLEIAFEIGKQLEENGYIVVYTRTDDRLLYRPEEDIKGIRKISDLKNRCKIISRYPQATFISIHMNSFGDSKYSGLQVYYSPNNEKSLTLAQCIQNKVRDDLQPDNNRQTKNGENMYVLKNTQNPGALIECGFLTNSEECLKLSSKEYQKALSFSIVCGIIEYMNSN
jgi:N-acetylmuramoyl-L-alanine amidase